MREGFYYFMTFQDRLDMESINDATGQASQAIMILISKSSNSSGRRS